MVTAPRTILALDVGARRVGVAAASTAAGLPRPLATLVRDEGFFEALRQLIDAEDAERLVVGLPRNLNGQPTAQTAATKEFAAELRRYELPLHFQDEAVTSRQAETELQARGRPYRREDIDALAATYILADFLAENRELAG